MVLSTDFVIKKGKIRSHKSSNLGKAWNRTRETCGRKPLEIYFNLFDIRYQALVFNLALLLGLTSSCGTWTLLKREMGYIKYISRNLVTIYRKYCNLIGSVLAIYLRHVNKKCYMAPISRFSDVPEEKLDRKSVV